MRARAFISGSLVWEGDLDTVPQVGTALILETQSYKKGHWPGTILRFQVSADDPPTIDLTGDRPLLILDVNGWTVLEEGPVPPGQERD